MEESRLTFRSKVTDEAWQYKIREKIKADWGNKYKFWENIDLSLKNAIVKKVDRKVAEKIILEYEWLGDMAVTNIYYGIFFENFCGGVICINSNGHSANPKAEISLGVTKGKLSYFARGACPFWTPKGSASKLLSFALKLEKERGAKMAIAFSDYYAGEYGTVYQASNWHYIGLSIKGGSDKSYAKNNRILDGRTLTSYAQRQGMSVDKYRDILLKEGWRENFNTQKGRYVYILADGIEKKMILDKINKLILPYPKRPTKSVISIGNDAVTNPSEEGGAVPTITHHE